MAGVRQATACPRCASWRARRAARRARRRARTPRCASRASSPGATAPAMWSPPTAPRGRAPGSPRPGRCGWPAVTIPRSTCSCARPAHAVAVAPGPRGSLAGLVQLARGGADAATVHLRHAPTGCFNDPFVRAALPGERTVLVHLWRREQGLVVAPGNPLGIRGVADLAGHRLAWRAPGTASRLLLERLLLEAGIDARPGSEAGLRLASRGRGRRGDGGCRCRPGGARGRPLRGARVDPRRHRAVRAGAASRRPGGGRAAARRAGEHGGAPAAFRAAGLRPHRERTNEEGGVTRSRSHPHRRAGDRRARSGGLWRRWRRRARPRCPRERDDDPGDDDQHARLRAARRPGSRLRARLRVPGQDGGGGIRRRAQARRTRRRRRPARALPRSRGGLHARRPRGEPPGGDAQRLRARRPTRGSGPDRGRRRRPGGPSAHRAGA